MGLITVVVYDTRAARFCMGKSWSSTPPLSRVAHPLATPSRSSSACPARLASSSPPSPPLARSRIELSHSQPVSVHCLLPASHYMPVLTSRSSSIYRCNFGFINVAPETHHRPRNPCLSLYKLILRLLRKVGFFLFFFCQMKCPKTETWPWRGANYIVMSTSYLRKAIARVVWIEFYLVPLRRKL